MTNRFVPLVLALCAVSLPAQGRTWIVDAANGPGTDFVDLPPAVSAAAAGDVLSIRAGSYQGFSTNKALTLIGTPGLTTIVMSASTLVRVEGLPAGSTFAMRDIGLDPLGFFPLPIFWFRSCAGTVVLQGIQTRSFFYPPILAFTACRAVCLTACGLPQGSSYGFSVNAYGSDVTIQGCNLKGQRGFDQPPLTGASAVPGLVVANGSRVSLANTTVVGGAGSARWPFVGEYYQSAEGVSIPLGQVRIGLGCTVAAGTGGTVTQPMSAITGSGSIDLDPSVPVTPYAGAPAIGAGITVTTRTVSALTVGGGALGGQVEIELASAPARPFVLAVGSFTVPLATPFGNLYLPLASMLVLANGLQSAQGSLAWSLPVPTEPTLFAQHLTWQAAAEDENRRLELTNPAVVLLR